MLSVGRLLSLNIAKAVSIPYGSKQVDTGIFKKPSERPLLLTKNGIDGDEQADLINHGGPDKAICVYSADHYPYWQEVWKQPVASGAFGENFTVSGMTEELISIGDIIRVGQAFVQVSQPRSPCFKLGVKHNNPKLQLHVQQTGYTGFYFRVLKEGIVQEGDELFLDKRHPAAFTIREANLLMYVNKTDRNNMIRLLGIEELSESWRDSFISKLAALTAEND
ncbi:hypothetical protein Back11_12790 [Paenibacillus baekrokdamisoli]|uniref:Uncharacterized protein n=1 Tax=Paenibacillus baekrokdamisoli TaxID=1712516 RepID=A0A3G9J9G1_9BACL|nr:MOSC domain-containing protein [Paenibacillus baekrokdamisoli]MBB3070583.1 MOSC domain-containing protein YiiM [Paenibacillus baekrokdamisoli]BBH19934.1 hypothetical protein Back11_12790 [Paenibacillus baekrokdamisoli]